MTKQRATAHVHRTRVSRTVAQAAQPAERAPALGRQSRIPEHLVEQVLKIANEAVRQPTHEPCEYLIPGLKDGSAVATIASAAVSVR